MKPFKSRLLLIFTLLLVLALGLAACGDDEEDNEETRRPTATATEVAMAATEEATEEPVAATEEATEVAMAATEEATEEPVAATEEATEVAMAATEEATEEPIAATEEATEVAMAATEEATEEPVAATEEATEVAMAATEEATEEPVAATEEATEVAIAATEEATEEPVAATEEATEVAIAATEEAAAGEKTIADIIAERRTLRVLGTALEAAGLSETLSGEGPFTVFAPISAAFQAVPDEDLQALLGDAEALSTVLLYHVVPGKYLAADLAGLSGQEVETASGEPLTITVDESGNVLLNDTVRVVTTDLEASNGVIHFIDLVLTPPSMQPEPTEEAAAPATTLGTEDDPVVLLFIPSENAQEVQAGADDLAALLSEATGLVIEARVSTDFAAAIEAMCSGEAEIGALNTFSYILAHERGCADVGVVSVRFGSTYYQGQVVVSAESGITDFEGLKGTTFCRPDPLSTSGWIIPSIAMRANGVDPDTDLEVVDVGGHDAVITAVYNGECQAGATFVDARGNVADEYADVNDKVLVIAESAPIPNDTLSFSAEVPAEMREAIVAALVEIAADEENVALLDAVYSWGGLEAADDSFFDDFRQQLDAAGIDIEDLN